MRRVHFTFFADHPSRLSGALAEGVKDACEVVFDVENGWKNPCA
jgi:hypothetical protein